ncbi:MAG: dihydropteroate synthase [Acidimicrobiales bacterium]
MPPGCCRVMGVLNVTPDSFSDGGRWFDHAAAVDHGRALFGAGADVVDVGGESTRPGAEPVGAAEEIRRVVPVIEALARLGRVSVDTRHREVAEAAVSAGATLVNDVSASLAQVAAEAGVGWVAMHMQGQPSTMQAEPSYGDVVAEVAQYLFERADAAVAIGVEEVWVDPGIGFGKTFDHNLKLLRHLRRIVDGGYPVVVGTSRKAFVRRLCGDVTIEAVRSGDDVALEGSLTTAIVAMNAGVGMVRVHDVAETVRAARLLREAVAA